MSSADLPPIVMPRAFKLRLEYNAAAGKNGATFMSEKHSSFISYMIHTMTDAQKEDAAFDTVGYWQGLIIGEQGQACGQEMYSFVIKIPLNYPVAPPMVRFATKISLSFVDSRGYVDPTQIPGFKWTVDHNIADLLMAIRDNMSVREYINASARLIGQSFFSPSTVDPAKNFM